MFSIQEFFGEILILELESLQFGVIMIFKENIFGKLVFEIVVDKFVELQIFLENYIVGSLF